MGVDFDSVGAVSQNTSWNRGSQKLGTPKHMSDDTHSKVQPPRSEGD
jgi:hypothetical protein